MASRTPTPSTSRAASAAPSAAADTTTDVYRPIAAQIQKPLAPLLPSAAGAGAPPNLPTLMDVDGATYSSRVSGKTLMLTDLPSAGPSSLVSGRKAHAGDPKAKAAARAAAEGRARARRDAGVVGPRGRPPVAVISRTSRMEYAALLPLHHLHCAYLAQTLALPVYDGAAPRIPAPDALQGKLAKTDFTGARLRVRASRNPSLVGLAGIVVEETAGSFRLLGEDGRARVVPKAGAQFTIAFPACAIPEGEDVEAFVARCPQIEVDILGGSFAFRSGDRAGRKFRPAQGGGGGSGWAEEWVEGEWSTLLRGLEGEAQKKIPSGRRKKGKSRRKDPLAHGSVQVFS
ncbi:hypothetical protein Q8F55_003082 [Vanrija albida]|uniref:Uncharacterized protein n=1 Tax=Vanrija albida TaxID=181172 RepID=A0ABR3QBR3_9TREE